jgi:hypothetical protein
MKTLGVSLADGQGLDARLGWEIPRRWRICRARVKNVSNHYLLMILSTGPHAHYEGRIAGGHVALVIFQLRPKERPSLRRLPLAKKDTPFGCRIGGSNFILKGDIG